MTINIGIIGAGAIARHAFIPGFAPPGSPYATQALYDWNHDGCPDVRVVALASRTRAQADQLAADYAIPTVYDDWQELVNARDIDAVCVTTPNYLHHPMTVAACRAGKHVLVEKPLAMNMAEARQMVQAAADARVVLMVQQSQRFFPAHEVAKQVLDSSILGPILTLRARWSHRGPEFWSPQGAWFFNPAQAGHGALFDLGIHKFDLIRYLTGKEAAEVSAFTGTLNKKIEVDDNGIALIRFTDQTLGVVEASWTGEPLENSIRLYGTRGYLQVNSDSTFPISVHFLERPSDLSLLPAGEWQPGLADTHIFVPHVPATSRVGGVFRHFADCITTGRECIASGQDNLKSFEIAIAAFQSQDTGCAVSLPI